MTLLVVDDENACADSLALGLRLKGHDVQVARGGIEALTWLESHYEETQLVLLDIMMPEIDGIEVLRRMKANPLLENIPVILQTGISDMRAIEGGIRLGAQTWIQKPFSNKQIAALVASFVSAPSTS